MAAVDKKDMNAKLDILPWMEMNGKQKKWFQENFGGNSKVKKWSYDRKVKLDPREWDANKLQKGINALVRYEAKLFAARAEEWMKKIEKAKDKDKVTKECLTKLPAYFKDIYSKMTLKMDKALDEIESGNADNKGAISTGKALFEKIKGMEVTKTVEKSGAEISDCVIRLEKKVKSTPEKTEKYMDEAISEVKKIEESFSGQVKACIKLVKEMNDTSVKMQKDKKSDAQLQKLGDDLVKLKPRGKLIIADMMNFQGKLKAISENLKKTEFEDLYVKGISESFKNAHRGYKAEDDFKKQIEPHKKRYKTLVKDLEK